MFIRCSGLSSRAPGAEGGPGAGGLYVAVETFSFWVGYTRKWVGLQSRRDQPHFTPQWSSVVVSGFAWEVEGSGSLLLNLSGRKK